MIQMNEYIAPKAEAKTDRKDLKVQPSVLAIIKRAAQHVGMDSSTFITTAAFDKAKEIELAQFSTSLPEAQFAAFAAAVDGDGKANDALANSIAKSRTLFVDA
jgi:uncharacterized protein (DUF1778 family)